jgi:predicted Zn-dependent peptidase
MRNRTIRTDLLTGADMITYEHEGGFSCSLIPRPGFSKKYAGILIPFGSIHSNFDTLNGQIELPAGSAHYMEHCIFSKADHTGLLSELSALGANVNAYTSNTHTLYYFTCVDHFEQAFTKYLQAVLNPYLEPDRVESERKIILQEIKMHEDDPDSVAYNEVLESLYLSHPVRNEIGGTPESVKSITSEHLKFIRTNYYNPHSIRLTVAGDLSEQDLLRIVDGIELGKRPEDSFLSVTFPQEESLVAEHEREKKMDVSMESFLIGIKNPFSGKNPAYAGQLVPSARQILQYRKGGQLLFEMMLGKTSELFETLYASGMINDSFGFHYVYEDTYSYLVAGGESLDPEKAADQVLNMLARAIESPIDPVEFEAQKRSSTGRFVRSLDIIESCGRSSAMASLSGVHLFDIPEIYAGIKADQILASLQFAQDRALSTRVLIRKIH